MSYITGHPLVKSCGLDTKTSPRSTLLNYSSVTTVDISRLLGQAHNKHCSLDPCPTWLVKSLSVRPDILTKLVNTSLQSGTFPSSQRHALVTPALKKPYLDPSVPSNYRPISNLSFVSKLFEGVVARQLTAHLEFNNIIPAVQSAYRRNHSTETALLKICNDALWAADNCMVTFVVLLDYSAAFDHSIMLNILEQRCGVIGQVLQWDTSYLRGRSYAVVACGVTSETVDLDCGIPQGSSIGPLKFVVYAADLHAVTSRHHVIAPVRLLKLIWRFEMSVYYYVILLLCRIVSLMTHSCTDTRKSEMYSWPRKTC